MWEIEFLNDEGQFHTLFLEEGETLSSFIDNNVDELGILSLKATRLPGKKPLRKREFYNGDY